MTNTVRVTAQCGDAKEIAVSVFEIGNPIPLELHKVQNGSAQDFEIQGNLQLVLAERAK